MEGFEFKSWREGLSRQTPLPLEEQAVGQSPQSTVQCRPKQEISKPYHQKYIVNPPSPTVALWQRMKSCFDRFPDMHEALREGSSLYQFFSQAFYFTLLLDGENRCTFGDVMTLNSVEGKEPSKEIFEWIQIRKEIGATDDIVVEGGVEKLKRKFRENPFVPIGATATVGCLTYGLYCFRRGDTRMSQYMMRARVAAQGFTLLALVGGIYFATNKTIPNNK